MPLSPCQSSEPRSLELRAIFIEEILRLLPHHGFHCRHELRVHTLWSMAGGQLDGSGAERAQRRDVIDEPFCLHWADRMCGYKRERTAARSD